MFLFGSTTVTAELSVDPLGDVPDAFRRRDYVEGRRDGAALLEVTDPELAACEFPLDVCSLLF